MSSALPRREAIIRPGIREFWLTRRDKLLASPKFQAWAAKFPLTRLVARREARALFDLCAGFVYAQTLTACIELDVFEMLGPGPLSVEALAARCRLPVAAMNMLANAAISLRLLQAAGSKIRLGPLGAALRGNPGIAAMVAHHRMFYADIADPVALLRGQVTTELAKFWPYRGQAGQSSGQSAAYSAVMAASQPMIAREIIAAYDFTRHRKLLDAGGGDGAFLRILAPHAPKLALQLFELPAVADSARAKLGSKAEVFEGNFTTDKLPEGADIITLIRVLHDHDDAVALTILKAAHAALAPGGVLLLAEPMAGTKGAEPIGAAYFGFYLLAMGSGRARLPAEIRAMLIQAGFLTIKQLPTRQPMLTSLLIASV
jgi:demethylspheroidene O-methyltransferase